MFGQLFAPLAMKISAGIVAVLLIALAVCLIEWSNAARARDEALQELGAEQTRHAVTRQSVETLEAEIARVMDRALEREAEFQEAKERAAQLSAENARLARRSDARIAELRKIMEEQGDGQCLVDEDLAELAEGL